MKVRLTKDHYLQAKKPGAKPEDQNPWAKEPQLHEQGSTIDWDGPVSLQMEGVDAEGKEAVAERRVRWNERKEKARQARSQIGWSQQYANNLERILTRPENPDADPIPSTGVRRSKVKAA